MKTRFFGSMFVLMALIACGGGSDSPTSSTPQGPQYPNVAGTWSGPVTEQFNGVPTGNTWFYRMTVVQAGADVTISGTMTLGGQSYPTTAVGGTVNTTGNFTATSGLSGSTSCGPFTVSLFSLTFAGNTAQYVENGTACGIAYQYSGTLTR